MTTNDGSNILDLASANKNQEVFKFLVKKCPDLINLKTDAGWTALYVLCHTNQTETLRFLLSLDNLSIDFNVAETVNGWTPLHIAAGQGHVKVVTLLLELSKERKIDIYKKDIHGMNALDLAKSRGHQSTVQAIEKWQTRAKLRQRK